MVLSANVNKPTQKYCVACLESGTTLGDKSCRTFFMSQIFRSFHVFYVWFVWVWGAEAEPTKSIPKSSQRLEHSHLCALISVKIPWLGCQTREWNSVCGNSPAPKPVAVAKTIETKYAEGGVFKGKSKVSKPGNYFFFSNSQVSLSYMWFCWYKHLW